MHPLPPLLALLTCGAPAAPVPPVPAEKAEAPAVATPDPPPPTELCDDAGCRPYRAMTITSAAADTEAAAVLTGDGRVALWVDGRWRGAFVTTPAAEVVQVTREGAVVHVVVCRDAGCARYPWTEAGFGPSEPLSGRRPKARDPWRLGAWQVDRSTLVRAGDAPLALRPRTALAGEGCATRFEILGDPAHPFALCAQHPRLSLHHVVGDDLVTLVEPWDATWAPLGAASVHAGAGCSPCLATQQGVLARGEDGWDVLPNSPEAREVAWARNPTSDPLAPPPIAMARADGRVVLGVGDRAWAWDGAWIPTETVAAWAERLEGWPLEGETVAHASPEALIVVGGGAGFLYRPWASFLPADAAPTGYGRVRGVADDDVLNVRVGPTSRAPGVAVLAPGARCVRTYDARASLGGAPWRAIALPDGTRGWVSERFLEVDAGCDAR